VSALIVNLALLAPFLDGQTFAVVHLDAKQIDLQALRRGLGKHESLEHFEGVVGKWKESFISAGGRDVFLVFSLADLPGAGFLVIPCPDESNAAALGRVLRTPESEELQDLLLYLRADPQHHPMSGTRIARIGSAYIVAPGSTVERLRKNRAVPRPELTKAFEAAGNGMAQLVLAPSADQRRIIEEMLPTLSPDFGGGSSKILTRGILWSALGIEASPKLAVRWTVQSQDEASAQALQAWLEHFFQKAAANPVAQRYLPNLKELTGLLKPKASKDQVTLVLSEGEQAAPALLTAFGLVLDIVVGRSDLASHLKQIALAMHNYSDAHKTFPAFASFDKDGRPLLSWRVHILPWLDQEKLYKQFHLDEPWDSEHNKKLIPLIPDVYRSRRLAGKPPGYTSVLGPVGKSLFFTGDQQGIRIQDITDGTSNTIMVVEADPDHAVPWTKPEDLKVEKDNPEQGLGEHAPGVFVIAFADGSAHFVPITIDKQSLYHLFTRNGGEVVDFSKF
jgi:hypothetical protein